MNRHKKVNIQKDIDKHPEKEKTKIGFQKKDGL